MIFNTSSFSFRHKCMECGAPLVVNATGLHQGAIVLEVLTCKTCIRRASGTVSKIVETKAPDSGTLDLGDIEI